MNVLHVLAQFALPVGLMFACLAVAELIVRSGIFHMIGRALAFPFVWAALKAYKLCGGKSSDIR